MSEIRVSITEAKQQLGDLVKRVSYGEDSVVIEFRGKPQAVIQRYGGSRRRTVEADLELGERMRALRKRTAVQYPEQEDSVEIIRRMREERDEQILGLH